MRPVTPIRMTLKRVESPPTKVHALSMSAQNVHKTSIKRNVNIVIRKVRDKETYVVTDKVYSARFMHNSNN